MICPKCEHLQPDALECARCGVVVAKVRRSVQPTPRGHRALGVESGAVVPLQTERTGIPLAPAAPPVGRAAAEPVAPPRRPEARAPAPPVASAPPSGPAAALLDKLPPKVASALRKAWTAAAAFHASRPPPIAARMLLLQQLGRMSAARMPLLDSLADLGPIVGPGPIGAAVHRLRSDVAAGARLSVAMAALPAVFDDVEVALVAAAEGTDRLGPTCLRLSERLAGLQRLHGALTASFGYPLFVAATACVTLPIPRLMTHGGAQFAADVVGNFLLLGLVLLVAWVGLPTLVARPRVRAILLQAGALLPGVRQVVLGRRFLHVFDALERALDAGLSPGPALALATRMPGEPQVAAAGVVAGQGLAAQAGPGAGETDAKPSGSGLAAAVGKLPDLDRQTIALLATAERTSTLRLALVEQATARREAYERHLRGAAVAVRAGVSLLLAAIVAASVIGRFRDTATDPLSMMPVGDQEELRRELERAMQSMPK